MSWRNRPVARSASAASVEQPPAHHQAGDGGVDRVLDDVGPGRHAVAEGDVAVVELQDLVEDAAGHRR